MKPLATFWLAVFFQARAEAGKEARNSQAFPGKPGETVGRLLLHLCPSAGQVCTGHRQSLNRALCKSLERDPSFVTGKSDSAVVVTSAELGPSLSAAECVWVSFM